MGAASLRGSAVAAVLSSSLGLSLGLSVGGCQGERRPSTPGCEPEALDRLGERLALIPVSERGRQVWPGVEGACPRLPETFRRHFDPMHTAEAGTRFRQEESPPETPLTKAREEALAAERVELETKACPARAKLRGVGRGDAAQARAEAVFETCAFDRFGVVDADALGPTPGLMSFALYQWFLDQGLKPASAQPVVRALYGLEASAAQGVSRPSGLRLPEVQGGPWQAEWGQEPQRGGGAETIVIGIATDGIFVNGKQVHVFEGERAYGDYEADYPVLIPQLYDELERWSLGAREAAAATGDEWLGTAVLVVDAPAPYATVINVLHSARGAGYERYAFAVEPEGFRNRYVPTHAPDGYRILDDVKPGDRGHDSRYAPDTLSLELMNSGLTLRSRVGLDLSARHPRGSTEAVAQWAETLRALEPKARRVVISAYDTITTQELLAAIVAARGPECGAAEDPACALPEAVLLTEYAHEDESAGGTIYVSGRFAHSDRVFPGEVLDYSDEARGYGYEDADDEPPKTALGVRVIVPEVEGAVDALLVHRVVRARLSGLLACLDDGTFEETGPVGQLIVELGLDGEGAVRSATLGESTVPGDAAAPCIVRSFEGQRFPAPLDGKPASVRVPLELRWGYEPVTL